VRLYCLRFGHEVVPESLSLRGGSRESKLVVPVTGAAVEYSDGAWVLLDTGLNPTILADPVLRAHHYVFPDYEARVPPGDPLLDEVRRCGLKWDRLELVTVSHLHCDHSGGLRHMAGGPDIVIQAREHDYAFGEAGVEQAYFRTDYGQPDLNWRLVDGVAELAPGLRTVPTFGHTPGHMSIAIDLPGARTVVLAFDAADLRRNITERIPCGSTTHADLAAAAQESIDRLHALDASPGVEVWPGHDPQFWSTRPQPPRAYS
jgi:N-acyl homoserine lactone hydrolase